MKESQIIHIENIGPVLFERSHKAKSVIVTCKVFKGVRAVFPYDMELEDAKWSVINSTYVIQTLQIHAREAEAHLRRQPDISLEEARKILKKLVNKYAIKYGYSYNSISVKAVSSYWGSCSRENDIVFNVILLKLPNELRDYMILHELVHTKHPYHGRVFWDELLSMCPYAKVYHQQIRWYS